MPYAGMQRAAKRLALADNTTLQRIDALRCVLAHGSRQFVERTTSASYAHAQPEVSAVVTVYNYADVVVETLDSLAASTDVDIEIVIVDDHATDDSRDVVRSWIHDHPTVAAMCLGKDANQGLASARNLCFTEARADFVMVMDADNHVYPSCLSRLRQTLLDHPSAAAVYAILEDFGDGRNVRSCLDWDPSRLCRANYIDAQAMWRKPMWEDLGGYRSDDDAVYGWEDWDLWLRLAAHGGHAVLRREMLGRYRVQPGSMIALTNLATADAIEQIRRRYPTLPWPTDS
jgi:glycosyltransferase involved in cell wall biosynthesis